MDLDLLLDTVERCYPNILDDIMKDFLPYSAGWVNDMGRNMQLKYLLKEKAIFTEEELIQEIKTRLEL